MKMYKIKKKTTKLDYVLEKIREEFDLSIEKQPFWSYKFETFTPEDQDFMFVLHYVKSYNDLMKKLNEKWNEFDVSYETYLWLGPDGHGINGAPYDMMDVYNDMQYCKDLLKDIYDYARIMRQGLV